MHPRHVFTFVLILAVAYFAFLYRALSIGFACLSAMIALILSGFFVIVSVVDATHAYGHLIGFMLPDMSPLWPLRFAIAWTLVSLLLGSWLFWFWRQRCMWELFHCFTFNSGSHCVCSFVLRSSEHKHVYIHKHTHAYARRNAHIQTCLYWYLFWLKCFDKLQRLPTVACSVAMVAIIAIALLAIAPSADGAHAFGHQIAVVLSQDCPLWPCQFFDAFSETMMLRVYNSGW